jgi:phosphoribosyl 1,2-cyclic phosphate phosphodiesterase
VQCLAQGIDRVDAVLYTHHHADHVSGLDDLRRFNHLMGTAISCHATERTIGSLRRMFAYAFEPRGDDPTSRPRLHWSVIDHQPFVIGDVTVTPIPLFHGEMPVLGFRIGAFAYCTDCSRIPDESYPLLEGLDVLILDALRRRPHPTHFHLARAVEEARRIGARQTLFTHIAHELGQAETDRELPDGMTLAYDGQRVYSQT